MPRPLSNKTINTIDAPFRGSTDRMAFTFEGEMTAERMEHMRRFINEVVLPWAEFRILTDDSEREGDEATETIRSEEMRNQDRL